MEGIDYIEKDAKWVLLIDSDEIPDSENFKMGRYNQLE